MTCSACSGKEKPVVFPCITIAVLSVYHHGMTTVSCGCKPYAELVTAQEKESGLPCAGQVLHLYKRNDVSCDVVTPCMVVCRDGACQPDHQACMIKMTKGSAASTHVGVNAYITMRTEGVYVQCTDMYVCVLVLCMSDPARVRATGQVKEQKALQWQSSYLQPVGSAETCMLCMRMDVSACRTGCCSSLSSGLCVRSG